MQDHGVVLRPYNAARDANGLRECFIQLQDYERGLVPAMPPGDAVADDYLKLIFGQGEKFGGFVLVADLDGKVAGFISVFTALRSDSPDVGPEPYAYVSDLVVRDSQRGRGLGRRLLKEAADIARRRGATRLRLSVKAGNDPAIHLYRTAGFSDFETIMEKKLDE